MIFFKLSVLVFTSTVVLHDTLLSIPRRSIIRRSSRHAPYARGRLNGSAVLEQCQNNQQILELNLHRLALEAKSFFTDDVAVGKLFSMSKESINLKCQELEDCLHFCIRSEFKNVQKAVDFTLIAGYFRNFIIQLDRFNSPVVQSLAKSCAEAFFKYANDNLNMHSVDGKAIDVNVKRIFASIFYFDGAMMLYAFNGDIRTIYDAMKCAQTLNPTAANINMHLNAAFMRREIDKLEQDKSFFSNPTIKQKKVAYLNAWVDYLEQQAANELSDC